MRALSLWQPWATAMREGVKLVETRSWAPAKRARFDLAIHAAKRVDRKSLRHVDGKHYPTGCVLGVVHVVSIKLMQERTNHLLPQVYQDRFITIGDVSELERSWGDWRPDRYAWFTRPLVWFDIPIPCIGRQGLFTLPPAVADEVSARLATVGEAFRGA